MGKKLVARCPKCEKDVDTILGSESVKGEFDDCEAPFLTATWWKEKRGAFT